MFRGNEVNYLVQDPRNPTIVYAAVHTLWFGPHVHASRNGGKTWALSDAGLEMKCVPDSNVTDEQLRSTFLNAPAVHDILREINPVEH